MPNYGLKHRRSKLPLSDRNHPRWRPGAAGHSSRTASTLNFPCSSLFALTVMAVPQVEAGGACSPQSRPPLGAASACTNCKQFAFFRHRSFRLPNGTRLRKQSQPGAARMRRAKNSPVRVRFSASAGSGLHDVARY